MMDVFDVTEYILGIIIKCVPICSELTAKRYSPRKERLLGDREISKTTLILKVIRFHESRNLAECFERVLLRPVEKLSQAQTKAEAPGK